jgi:hypothetical protein
MRKILIYLRDCVKPLCFLVDSCDERDAILPSFDCDISAAPRSELIHGTTKGTVGFLRT